MSMYAYARHSHTAFNRLSSSSFYSFGGRDHGPVFAFLKTNVNRLSMRASRDGDHSDAKSKKQKALAPNYSPKTPHQRAYCRSLSDPDASIILGVGPAGTGKTLFACITAIQMLRRGEIQKIVLTRPVVAVEEDLGFLPGNMVMKMDPWTRPIFDIFLEFYAQKDVDAMVQGGTIEISPLAYMRGRTFKRAFIIADEMQNSSPNQMLMLITRIGDGSKMVITGDLKQSDRSADNGLQDLLRKLYRQPRRNDSVPELGLEFADIHGEGNHSSTASSSYPSSLANTRSASLSPFVHSVGGIHAVEFTAEDIERSLIVKQVLSLYEPTPTPVVHAQTNPLSISIATNMRNETGANEQRGASYSPNATTAACCVLPNRTAIIVRENDAAIIPKHHASKHFSR
jgi:phosphate starvation-inducible PhoH-like protein